MHAFWLQDDLGAVTSSLVCKLCAELVDIDILVLRMSSESKLIWGPSYLELRIGRDTPPRTQNLDVLFTLQRLWETRPSTHHHRRLLFHRLL